MALVRALGVHCTKGSCQGWQQRAACCREDSASLASVNTNWPTKQGLCDDLQRVVKQPLSQTCIQTQHPQHTMHALTMPQLQWLHSAHGSSASWRPLTCCCASCVETAPAPALLGSCRA
jgi:hypothetical protein